MSGGNFSCGDWIGGNKTATYFFVALNAMQEEVLTDQQWDAWSEGFAEPLNEQLKGLDREGPIRFEFSPTMMEALLPVARRYYEILMTKNEHPTEERIWRQEGIDEDVKWQLLSLIDLFKADQAQQDSGKPIVLRFD